MIGRLEDAAELLVETTGTVIKPRVEPVIELSTTPDRSMM